MLRFDGQVALITGAAGGLGQEWAKALHSRGATCVLVDIDQRVLQLTPPSSESAAKWECVVANCANERSGRQVVEHVLTTHGRVDILLHATTQVQDAAFRKMTRTQWDMVLDNDLTSAFTMTRAVWAAMRQQNYGRILLCTSASGLYGNFGQVNYATTKSGILGLTKALSIEGRKYKIGVNALAAVAGTTLTQSVMPEDVFHRLKPEYTSPFVVYLCHATCGENGSVLETGGGWIGKLRLQRSVGVGFPLAATPEAVASSWAQVTNFAHATYPASTQDSFAAMLDNVNHPPTTLRTPHAAAVAAVFDRLRATLATKREPLRSSGMLEWAIGDAHYTVGLSTNTVTVGHDQAAELVLIMTEVDFLALVAGTLRPQQAMASKKLTLRGDLKLAMRLQPLLTLLQDPIVAKL
ncbi:Aste57867_15125 [Aphanomyces stellatus]|uniref:Aste57867_15125 protein n=1 Tax=Aphanomyces stellatus TaxID=120398 RepID=A0A485L3E5_9STRA|nr:hypothetical protein As57867_015069 [Aphanomyces stellatus]VFT91935.1 Aste57867_15125 [Aphanomyces stellatus]